MILSELRRACRANYLGEWSDDEDSRFVNDQLNEFLNQEHRNLAAAAKLYRATKQFDVCLGHDGASFVALSPDVIEIIPDSVRLNYGGSWQQLQYVEEDLLLRRFGPLENETTGQPLYYYLRPGAELLTQNLLILFPGSDQAITDGLRVGCYLYPALLTDETTTSTPAFPPALHQWLVARVCLRMAEAEAGLGRPDAPVAYWLQKSAAAEKVVREAQERANRSGPRRIVDEETPVRLSTWGF